MQISATKNTAVPQYERVWCIRGTLNSLHSVDTEASLNIHIYVGLLQNMAIVSPSQGTRAESI